MAAAVIPMKDDAAMKEYLLEKEKRAAIVKAIGGRICSAAGIHELHSLIKDNAFVCLHYVCSPNSKLQACHEARPDDTGTQRAFLRFLF